MFKGIHHVTYVVEDLAATEAYMLNAFGMEVEKYQEQPELEERLGFKIAFYTVGSTILDFFQPVREGIPVDKFLKSNGPSVIHVGWEVKNIESIVKEFVAKGVDARQKDCAADSPQGYKTVSIDIPNNPLGLWFHLAEGPMTLR